MKTVKQKIGRNGNLPCLSMTKTISQNEMKEFRHRYSLLFQAEMAHRAATAFYKAWELQIQQANQLPEQFQINLTTGVVTWEQTQEKVGGNG